MKTRKPLARGNIYQFYGYPTKIKIKYVVFRGHPEDDGGLEGVAVEWIGSNRRSGFYPCKNDSQFWEFLIFRNAFDLIPATPDWQRDQASSVEGMVDGGSIMKYPFVHIVHERWAADRWKVMFFTKQYHAFHIGSECSSQEDAERLRAAFESALSELGVSVINKQLAESHPCASVPL